MAHSASSWTSWFDKHVYYRLEIGKRSADNPDQRISEDLRMFAFNTLDLAFGLLSSTVTLVSFVGILWAISGSVTLSLGDVSLEIPGFMVWVALLYAIVGSVLTHVIGRPLIRLNFQQQRVEADLRFGSGPPARELRGRRPVRWRTDRAPRPGFATGPHPRAIGGS